MYCFGNKDKECLEKECALWTTLNYGEEIRGRCALAWLPLMLIEFRQSVERLSDNKTKEEVIDDKKE